jgi:hypothetical protein
MSKSGGEVTTGYRYSLGIHLGVCVGPVDLVTRIYFAEYLAWFGYGDYGTIQITAPSLFGGEEREGGVEGRVHILQGEDTQTPHPYIVSNLGAANTPAYRGVLSILFDKFYVGNNPFLKSVSVTVQRIYTSNGAAQWYPEKAGVPVDESYLNGKKKPLVDYTSQEYQDLVELFSATPMNIEYYSQNNIKNPGQSEDIYENEVYLNFPEFDMNPAHILREILTIPEYNLSYTEDDIDDESFRAAADLFYEEGLGLSFELSIDDSNTNTAMADFITEVERHAACALVLDPLRGKWMIKPLRAGYNKEELLHLGPNDVSGVDSIVTKDPTELVNSVTVSYTDMRSTSDRSITVHNVAALIQTGARRVSEFLSFPGITKKSLAYEVAQRELAARGMPIRTVNGLKANRKASRLTEADLFVLDRPDFGINSTVFRVVKISRGSTEDESVVIDAVEDVFYYYGNANSVPQLPQEPIPQRPGILSTIQSVSKVIEAPYYFVKRGIQAGVLNGWVSDDPYLGFAIGLVPYEEGSNAGFYIYLDLVPTTGNYVLLGSDTFTPSFKIKSGVNLSGFPANNVAVEFGARSELIQVGQLYLIDNEIVQLTNVDISANLVSFSRAALDTIPEAHSINSVAVAFADNPSPLYRDFTLGPTEHFRIVPFNLTNVVMPTSQYAIPSTVTFNARFQRPYPPNDIKYNNDRRLIRGGYPSGAFTVSWVSRNRLSQTEGIVPHWQSTQVAAEPGTVYDLEIIMYKNSDPAYAYTILTVFNITDEGLTTINLNSSGFLTIDNDADYMLLKVWSKVGDLRSRNAATIRFNKA